MRNLADFALDALRKAGALKAQVSINRGEKREICVEKDEVSLFRTTFSSNISLTAIINGAKASLSLNSLDENSILQASEAAVNMAKAGQPDEANDIALLEEGENIFNAGLKKGDDALLYERICEFAGRAKEKHVTLIDGGAEFSAWEGIVVNTNGVFFSVSDGYYEGSFTFAPGGGGQSSSFNYSGGSRRDLDIPFWDCWGLGRAVEQCVKELEAKSLSGKFTGDIILTPKALKSFIGMYTQCYLSDRPIVSGTSTMKDSLGKKVASDMLTLISDPFDSRLIGVPVTPDGYRAEKHIVMENGVLKNFILSQYAALKTKHPRAGNPGYNMCVSPGSESLDTLIKDVKKGLLVGRFSGGSPAENGDFSGVAKNSFYIEDGQIAYPVTETMIASNLREMFENISGISKETIVYGSDIRPWMSINNIGISGS